MNKKVYIPNLEELKSEYRLVVNINSSVSLGVELTIPEIQILQFELKQILDNYQNMVKTVISV